MRTLEEIEASRSARRAGADKARAAQELADLDAIDALEESSGAELRTMSCNRFSAGVPVKIAFRAPNKAEYKRYVDQVGRAQAANDPAARVKAQELLATSCWVYPAEGSDARKAMLESFPGVLISLSIEAAKAAELNAENEGK